MASGNCLLILVFSAASVGKDWVNSDLKMASDQLGIFEFDCVSGDIITLSAKRTD